MIQLAVSTPVYQNFFLVTAIDPTKTITLRQRFVADMRARFARLMQDVREAVVTLDVFAIQAPTTRVNAAGLNSRQFNFPRNDQKVEAFVEWLREKEREYILSGGTEGIRRLGELSTDLSEARASWMRTYLDSAYQQGMRRARQELRKQGIEIDEGQLGGELIGVAFNGPVHADRVGLIYTRAYSSLQAITTEMESAVSDVLSMGMAQGKNPRELTRLLDKTITGKGESLEIVDSLGRKIPSLRRAEILARTEVIRAHHSANMGEYRAAGAMGITIQAEHLTAGDDRVCPKCAPLNGKRYDLDQAEFMIPVHPQCRCVAIPYIPEDSPGRAAVTQPAPVPVLSVPKKKKDPLPLQFQAASNIQEAEEYARKYKFAKQVDYSDFPLEMANQINQSIHDHFQRFEGLEGQLNFLGSMQRRNELYAQTHVDKLLKFYKEALAAGNITEEEVRRRALQDIKRVSFIPDNVWAQASSKQWGKLSGIAFNKEHYKDWVKFKNSIAKNVQTGWHPPGTEQFRSIMDHEYGHALDEKFKIGKRDKEVKKIYKDLSSVQIKEGVSTYATTSFEEFFAECWAEYTNSPTPRPLAKKVGDHIMQKYGRTK